MLLVVMLTDLVGLLLCRSCTGNWSCSEFMGAAAVPHPEDIVL